MSTPQPVPQKRHGALSQVQPLCASSPRTGRGPAAVTTAVVKPAFRRSRRVSSHVMRAPLSLVVPERTSEVATPLPAWTRVMTAQCRRNGQGFTHPTVHPTQIWVGTAVWVGTALWVDSRLGRDGGCAAARGPRAP